MKRRAISFSFRSACIALLPCIFLLLHASSLLRSRNQLVPSLPISSPQAFLSSFVARMFFFLIPYLLASHSKRLFDPISITRMLPFFNSVFQTLDSSHLFVTTFVGTCTIILNWRYFFSTVCLFSILYFLL